MDSEYGYLFLNLAGFFLPVVIVLVVGMALVATRRKGLGSPATIAIVGFALELLATLVGAAPTLLYASGEDPARVVQIGIALVGVVLRVVGFILLTVAFVQAAGIVSRMSPGRGRGPYPPVAPVAPPRAHPGQERGELIRCAIAELDEMGRTGTFHLNGHWNPRLHEIGRLLDGSGGMAAMQEAHAWFSRSHPPLGRELDVAWDGVGAWRG